MQAEPTEHSSVPDPRDARKGSSDDRASHVEFSASGERLVFAFRDGPAELWRCGGREKSPRSPMGTRCSLRNFHPTDAPS